MLQFLPVCDANTIAIRATGKLSHEDYQAFLPQLEKRLNTKNKISILFELDNFKGWDLKAAEDDLNFGIKHIDRFDRIAIVGDKQWEQWMTILAKPFLSADSIQYFDRENLQQAWDWLREKDELKRIAKQIQPYQKIVATTDFSTFSLHACKRAIELARQTQASLTLLHIIEEYIPYSYYGDTMNLVIGDTELMKQVNQQNLELAKIKMDDFVAELNTDITINKEVIIGSTESTIVSYLLAHDTDLAVFGAKKKSGFSRLLGSVPYHVQNHTHCETLIVPLLEPIEF